MKNRLTPAARRAIRLAMRRRPGAVAGNPLPPPGGTRAFWIDEASWGGFVMSGPAVWGRQAPGSIPGVWGATPSAAIVAALGRGSTPPPTA